VYLTILGQPGLSDEGETLESALMLSRVEEEARVVGSGYEVDGVWFTLPPSALTHACSVIEFSASTSISDFGFQVVEFGWVRADEGP